MDGAWIAGVFGILGSVVGGIATFLSSIYLLKKKYDKEAIVLSESLIAEISSILSLLHGHNYVTGLEKAIEETSKGSSFAMVWPVRRDYCRVFNSNVSHIGRLKKGAAQVVEFYNLVQSLQEDLDTLTEDFNRIFRDNMQERVDWTSFSPRYRVILGKMLLLIQRGNMALEFLK